MKSKLGSLTVIVLLVTGFCMGFISMETENVSAATTRYVGGSGPGNYTKIQWAIENASTGDTVFVYNGIYYENVLVDKTLNLTGENRETTIIDGMENGYCVNVTEDWVNITGFTITNGTRGINLESSFNKIIWNNISFNPGFISGHGIYCSYSSNNTIANNDISWNRERGIYVISSSNTTIIGNNIIFNDDDGITISSSNNITVTGNTIISNYYDGLNLYSSSNNTITGNNISNNYDGIYLSTSSCFNTISENDIISNDDDGLYLHLSSNNNTLRGNNIVTNGDDGIYITDSAFGNSIYHNNIIDNWDQAWDQTETGNYWDNGYPSGGNYWSDFDESVEGAYDNYSGINQDVEGRDGIIDQGPPAGGLNPHVFDFPARDYYPFLHPIGNSTFLYEGWNLISLPYIQSDTGIGEVLGSISGSYNQLNWYDATNGSDPWKINSTSKPPAASDLHNIDHKMGFWIHITEPGGALYEYSGAEPTVNQTIQLYKGWNLVGYPSLTIRNRTEALNNLTFGIEVDAIWTYDGSAQQWLELDEVSDDFVPGKGYWIHAKDEYEWEVPC